MASVDRRAVVVGGVALVLGGPRTLARADDDDQDPVVEFDGTVKRNPRCPGPGRVKAVGVVRVPPNKKLVKVLVRWQREADFKTGVFHGQVATVAEVKMSPTAWVAEFDNLDAGGYWFDVQVTFEAADGSQQTADGPEKRRVGVKGLVK